MAFIASAPLTFSNTNGGSDVIDFQADGPATNLANKIKGFVTQTGGDMLYRATGANNYLERLPIGPAGTALVSDGTKPMWGTGSTSGAAVFTAYVTTNTSTIPTSRSGGANPGVWFPLAGITPRVGWSTSSPGADPDGVFSLTPGATYGSFVAPSNGIYSFSASIAFDSGVGVAAGAGLPAGSLPSGQAVRQVRLFNVTTAVALATVTQQAEPFNGNITQVPLTAKNVQLVAGDVVQLQVRHDRSGTGTVTIGDGTIAGPNQSSFSGKRVR